MPNFRARFACILALAVSIATSACVRKSTHEKALKALNDCQGNLSGCQAMSDDQVDQIAKLEAELVTERAARQKADTSLAGMRKDLSTTEKELAELRAQRAAAEKRLAAFRELTDRFRKLVDTGKLDVVFRNGQMVLKLPAGILFASGRADLSVEGKTALQEVLDILLEFKDRRFMVAGHTDNLPIKGRRFKDNWDLSTSRAVTIVQSMIEAGFEPANLAAAGYGEHDPVAPNDTEEGRQLNRRIEIILVPDLSELPTLEDEQPGDQS